MEFKHFENKKVLHYAEGICLNVVTHGKLGMIQWGYSLYNHAKLGLVVAVKSTDGREVHIYEDGKQLGSAKNKLPKAVYEQVVWTTQTYVDSLKIDSKPDWAFNDSRYRYIQFV